MGLALAPNGAPLESGRKTNVSTPPERKQPRTFRKGWTLFILKQNHVSCAPENLSDEEPIEQPEHPPKSCADEFPPQASSNGNVSRTNSMSNEKVSRTNSMSNGKVSRTNSMSNGKVSRTNSMSNGKVSRTNSMASGRISRTNSFATGRVSRTNSFANGRVSRTNSILSTCTTVDGSTATSYPRERLRGLAAIVQDVLSRSRSDLRQKYGMKKIPVVEEDRLAGRVVEIKTELVEARNDSAPEMSLSFRMRLVDRCDTDVGVVASLRNCPPSSIACESSQSCRYPLQRPGEGASIVDLLERGKRLGIEDNSKVLTTRSSTADEYDCVVKRLRDARGTIRLLAATAVREATRNSPQAREDLWRAGAIPPLVSLLKEDDMGVCYMATVALLNLAIGSARNKQDMADCGVITILVRLMRPEATTSVRESATTVILSLAAADQLKPCIGSSGAIVYLSDILSNGTTQGRSDAVRALLNLSIFKGNRSIIVQAGVVSPLFQVILRDAKEAAEKGVILLSHLYQDREGRETISIEEQTCSVLFQVLQRDTFSQSCKEQTVVILLSLSGKPAVKKEAVFAQGILPALVEMALVGSSTKIQEKAAKLLKIIKEHRMDQGILSMDRAAAQELINRQLPLDRQYSTASTVDTSMRSSRRHIRRRSMGSIGSMGRSASALSGKEIIQLPAQEENHGKSSGFFKSFVARSFRSESMNCQTDSVQELINRQLPSDRQYSTASTVDTSMTLRSSKRHIRRRSMGSMGSLGRSASTSSGKDIIQLPAQEENHGKTSGFFKSFVARSFRSESMNCRTVSVQEPDRAPLRFMRSLCSQG